MTTDVFPPNNLEADQAPWARALEAEVRRQSYAISNLSVATSGDNRSSAGQMGALGRQIEELYGRSSIYLTIGPISVTATSGGGFVSGEGSVLIPPPLGGGRAAFVSGSSPISTPTSGAATTAIEVLAGGAVIYRGIPNISSSVPGFEPSVNFSGIINVPSDGTNLLVRLWVQSFSGTQTVQLTNISAGVIYADKS